MCLILNGHRDIATEIKKKEHEIQTPIISVNHSEFGTCSYELFYSQ
jgi:hypothetical protein